MNKESYLEAEKEYLFNSMEFSRLGYTYNDRKGCDIHQISFSSATASDTDMVSASHCPLCVLRNTFLCTPKEIELTKDEYATKLKENGYTQDHIKNIIDYVFKEESK